MREGGMKNEQESAKKKQEKAKTRKHHREA
jgi:hypothetical protein